MKNQFNYSTVAVIIPSYNCSRTIYRAISSVIKQTRPADEIIVVDDCSPDGEKIRAIAKSFPRVKYIRNKTNLGPAGTRNVGLFAADAEVVTFMDADDESHPQRIELQLKHLAPGSVVTCEVVRVAENTEPKYVYYKKEKVKSNFSPFMNALFNRITGAALMGETALLRRVGGYDKELRVSEDLDLYLRLLNHGYHIKKILLPLYVYHDISGSLTKDPLKVWQSHLKAMDKFIKARYGAANSWQAAHFWFLVLSKELVRAELYKITALRQALLNEFWRVSDLPLLKMLLIVFFGVFNRKAK